MITNSIIGKLIIKLLNEEPSFESKESYALLLQNLNIPNYKRIANTYYKEISEQLKNGATLEDITAFCEEKNFFINAEIFAKELQLFIQKNNRYPTRNPNSKKINEIKKEIRLNSRVNTYRQLRRTNDIRLTPEIIAKLDEINFVWRGGFDVDLFINNLQKFIKQYDRYPSKNTDDQEERYLCGQVFNLRQAKKGKGTLRLTQEMIEKLNNVNFVWNPSEKNYIDALIEKVHCFQVTHLGKYPNRYERVKNDKLTPEQLEEKKLALNILKIRRMYKNSMLTEKDVTKLKAANFELEVENSNEQSKQELFILQLQQFIKDNGRYPTTYSNNEFERKLATQVHHLRQAKKGTGKLKLSKEMIKKLNNIGFMWEAKSSTKSNDVF